MAALGASETAFWSPYGAQIHDRSVACTPFQTVSKRNSANFTLKLSEKSHE
jgi:hypothetical protein